MMMTMYFREWLAEKMAERGWKNAELANRVGVVQSSVSQWLSSPGAPRPHNVQKIAEALGVPLDEAFAAASQSPRAAGASREIPSRASFSEAAATLERLSEDMVEIPVIDISAGPGALTEMTYFLPRPLVGSRNVVGFRVRGQSMEPEIPEGALLAVDTDQTPKDGDIVVAWTPDGGVVKRLRSKRGKQELAGNNGEAIPVTDEVQIQGVVVSVTAFLR